MIPKDFTPSITRIKYAGDEYKNIVSRAENHPKKTIFDNRIQIKYSIELD